MKADTPRSPAASALFCAVLFCTLLLITVPVTAADTPTEPIADQDLVALNDALKAADGHFTPITEAEIGQAKTELLKAVENLDNEFRKIGDPIAEGWKKYLDWDKFTATLACNKPDMDQLKKANQALSDQHRGLELACFVDVRLTLEKYMNLRLAVDNPAIKKAYDGLMAKELPKMLKEYAARPTSNPSTPLNQTVAWLDKFD
ncbi:MAG: hypothetical protein PVH19_05335, partial [Planctomycetia bacterium]